MSPERFQVTIKPLWRHADKRHFFQTSECVRRIMEYAGLLKSRTSDTPTAEVRREADKFVRRLVGASENAGTEETCAAALNFYSILAASSRGTPPDELLEKGRAHCEHAQLYCDRYLGAAVVQSSTAPALQEPRARGSFHPYLTVVR